MKAFKNGLITGFILQLAIGPIFFFIVNLALQRTFWDGMVGAVAVTLADYVYIMLAIFGVGKLLEKKKVKKIFGVVSSVVLIIFGMIMVKSVLNNVEAIKLEPGSSNLGASFISVFVLTISSPMTIFLWTSIFTAKAIENNYSKRDFFVFGLGTGLATLVFMGMAVITLSLLKTSIPLVVIQVLNLIVGGLLILYGLIRLKRLFSR
jgi:threonine/homoserine/homoserine lactone efflux protein